MSLSNIIDNAISINTKAGVTNRDRAVEHAKAATLADEDATVEAVGYYIGKMVRERATKAIRGSDTNDPRQRSFFGNALRARYAIGRTGTIKDTECLSRLEWAEILNFKRKQMEDDTVHLVAMETANRELSPIWDEYPHKTYGEVEAIYLRRREAAE